MIFSVKIIDNMYINKDSNSIYIAGTKLCSKSQDYRLFLAYMMQFSKYLTYGKDLNQEATLEFEVGATQRVLSYARCYSNTPEVKDVYYGQNVSIQMSIKQKDGKKSLRIAVNSKSVFIEKIDLDVFVQEVQKFHEVIKGNHSFRLCNRAHGYDDQFLIDIGELILDADGEIL